MKVLIVVTVTATVKEIKQKMIIWMKIISFSIFFLFFNLMKK